MNKLPSHRNFRFSIFDFRFGTTEDAKWGDSNQQSVKNSPGLFRPSEVQINPPLPLSQTMSQTMSNHSPEPQPLLFPIENRNSKIENQKFPCSSPLCRKLRRIIPLNRNLCFSQSKIEIRKSKIFSSNQKSKIPNLHLPVPPAAPGAYHRLWSCRQRVPVAHLQIARQSQDLLLAPIPLHRKIVSRILELEHHFSSAQPVLRRKKERIYAPMEAARLSGIFSPLPGSLAVQPCLGLTQNHSHNVIIACSTAAAMRNCFLPNKFEPGNGLLFRQFSIFDFRFSIESAEDAKWGDSNQQPLSKSLSNHSPEPQPPLFPIENRKSKIEN
jgi:hypothetical protein